MRNYPSEKARKLEDRIKLFRDGITLQKQSAALSYAKDNDPEMRTAFLKHEYAESQVNVVIRWMEEGLVEIYHETNAFIAEAVRESKASV